MASKVNLYLAPGLVTPAHTSGVGVGLGVGVAVGVAVGVGVLGGCGVAVAVEVGEGIRVLVNVEVLISAKVADSGGVALGKGVPGWTGMVPGTQPDKASLASNDTINARFIARVPLQELCRLTAIGGLKRGLLY